MADVSNIFGAAMTELATWQTRHEASAAQVERALTGEHALLLDRFGSLERQLRCAWGPQAPLHFDRKLGRHVYVLDFTHSLSAACAECSIAFPSVLAFLHVLSMQGYGAIVKRGYPHACVTRAVGGRLSGGWGRTARAHCSPRHHRARPPFPARRWSRSRAAPASTWPA